VGQNVFYTRGNFLTGRNVFLRNETRVTEMKFEMREKQTEDLLMGIFSIVLLQANVQIQLN
jgi:hypothetical protein